VDEETSRFQRRMPGAGTAVRNDPVHHHLVVWMDRMLHLVDVVMEDEGIEPAVRAKVVRCVLYGSPNVADAELRMEQQQRMVDLVKYQAAPMVILPKDGEQR
jgi:hypothetical protein